MHNLPSSHPEPNVWPLPEPNTLRLPTLESNLEGPRGHQRRSLPREPLLEAPSTETRQYLPVRRRCVPARAVEVGMPVGRETTSEVIVQEPQCLEASQFFETANVPQLRTDQNGAAPTYGVVPYGVRDANLWIHRDCRARPAARSHPSLEPRRRLGSDRTDPGRQRREPRAS